MYKFKEGDKVQCVRVYEGYASSHITVGNYYVVDARMDGRSTGWFDMLADDTGCWNCYYEEDFELAEEEVEDNIDWSFET